MMRIIAAFLLILTLSNQAQAKNLFDELNNALDQLNNKLQRDLNRESATQRVRRDSSVSSETNTGICLAFGSRKQELFRNRCTAETICNASDECDVHYRWNETWMIANLQSGSPVRFIGSPVRESSVDGIPCVTQITGRFTFCFIDDHRSATKPDGPSESQADSNIDDEFTKFFKEKVRKKMRNQANREKKIEVMQEMVSTAEIDRFFANRTFRTLKPVDAVAACRDHHNPKLAAVLYPVPRNVRDEMRSRCVASSEVYGQTQAAMEGNRQAANILAKPANLDGLRSNNWFRLNRSVMGAFPKHQHRTVVRTFNSAVSEHFKSALAKAQVEIKAAFDIADPLEEPTGRAFAMCELGKNAPAALAAVCDTAELTLRKRIRNARCDRAIVQSGASKGFLERMMAVSGSRYESWTVRKVLCAGARNYPNYSVVIDEAMFPKWAYSKLQIFVGENRKLVLDVSLRVSTPRDGRSFREMLFDIATGENERAVPETLVVEYIHYVAPGTKGSKSTAIVGCVLGFIKCN